VRETGKECEGKRYDLHGEGNDYCMSALSRKGKKRSTIRCHVGSILYAITGTRRTGREAILVQSFKRMPKLKVY
jgi:hypothetical protein